MSNTIRDLVSEIQFVHKKDKWTIAHVAKSIGKTRVTLQRAMRSPEEEASKAIKALLIEKHGDVIQNVSRENSLNNPLPLGNLVVTLGDYVDLLKKQAEIYQKMAETNLGTILKNQEIGGGIVQELLERDVLREAKGNPKKAKELLEAIRLKISETSAITLIKYIPDGEGIAHK